MPVGLGKIRADAKGLLAKRGKDFIGDVGAWIGMEGNVRRGDAVVGQLGIEHRKAVMVLGCKHNVLHARIFRDAGPNIWSKADGIEGLRQRLVSSLVVHVVGPGWALDPVLGTD